MMPARGKVLIGRFYNRRFSKEGARRIPLKDSRNLVEAEFSGMAGLPKFESQANREEFRAKDNGILSMLHALYLPCAPRKF